MGGAIPPLPQYAFMMWCQDKKRTGTALSLLLTLPFLTLFSMAIISVTEKPQIV
jgi:hypothetical protein